MADKTLTGRRIAILATDGVEESELGKPLEALKNAGATVEIVSLKPGEIQSESKGKPGHPFKVDKLVSQVSADDYDALVLPGGVKNPDTLTNGQGRGELRARLHGRGQAGGRHLPWSVDVGGVGRSAWAHRDLVAQSAD